MRRPVLRAARLAADAPGEHQVDDRAFQLVLGEVEHVLFLAVGPEEAVLGQQRAELADLVEEQVGVPVLAVELVPLDIGEHAVGEADQLVVGRLVLFGVEQFAVVGDELLALLDQLRGRAFDIRARLDLLDIAGEAPRTAG